MVVYLYGSVRKAGIWQGQCYGCFGGKDKLSITNIQIHKIDNILNVFETNFLSANLFHVFFQNWSKVCLDSQA